jgi:hypothetical protein
MSLNRRYVAIAAGLVLLGGIVIMLSLPVVAEPSLESTRMAKGETEFRLLSEQIGILNDRLTALEARDAAPAGQPLAAEGGPGILTSDAAELLRAAATDIYGQIYVSDSNGSVETKGRKAASAALHIRTAEREFCLESTPRSYARWRAVLQALVHADYVEPVRADGLRATYRLTQAGYAAADQLPNNN